nr:hypothetical protein [Tanacetum cinerariifolium]
HHGFTELHQLDTFYNALNPADQDSLNAVVGGNLLEKSPQDALTIIENKSKVLIRTTNVLPSVATLYQSTGITFKVTFQQPQATTISLLQMNTASTSGSGTLPGNTIANPKGKLKAITTRSGLVTNGPTVPNPPKPVNPEEDECVEETYMDPDHAEYNIKVPPPPPVQKPKPPIQRNFNMFKQLHLNITLAEALVLMPKYQKMLKALLFNKEKLQELANTPLNENYSVIKLKKLPEKFRDPGKFLIPCGFSELKCKALADLGASINLMPLSVWKKLGLPNLIPTQMTLELANRVICTPDGIARDVFVPVDYLEDLVSNKQSGNPTFSLHKEIASPKVIPEIHDSKGCTFLSEELPDIDSFDAIHSYFDDDPLSGSTTYSVNSLLEEFADELALISYPPYYDDDRVCDVESDIREVEFLLFQGFFQG